jgi:hypothetical protein
MPYWGGEVPKAGDHVKTGRGRTGTVIELQLNSPSMQGHDQVSVRWDDGGFTGISLAEEYELVKRSDGVK